MSKIREHEPVDIYKLADEILAEIKPQVRKVAIAGSIRRKDPTANDLDFVIIPNPRNANILLKDSIGVNWSGDKKIQHVLKNGITVDLILTTQDSWGAALLHMTGPKGYDIGLKIKAKQRGWKLNEYGLFNRETNKKLAGKTEMEILKVFGKHWKKPEDR